MKKFIGKKVLWFSILWALCTSTWAGPSQELLDLFRNNVFIQHHPNTPAEADRLQKKMLLRLHPDKLSEDDKDFLQTHQLVWRLLYQDLAAEDISSLPMYILEEQKKSFLSIVKQGKNDYCDFCDQVVESNFLRVSFGDEKEPTYHYFHQHCLNENGLGFAKAAYLEGDLAKFSRLANILPEGKRVSAWLHFIKQELGEKSYHNVFNNLFTILPSQTDGYHNQPYLRELADTLFEQSMSIPTFSDHLKAFGKETSSMEYLFRSFIFRHMAKIAVPSEALAIADQASSDFSFAKSYFNWRSDGFVSKIIRAKKEDTDAMKHLIPFFMERFSQNEIKDFFMYDGHFNLFVKDYPREAQQIYQRYRSSLSLERREICEEQIAESRQRLQRQ